VDTNATRLDVCTTEPTTYAEATSTYSKGNKTGINPNAPSDKGGGGREVVIPAISDGSCTGDGVVAYWALTNGSDTLILTGALASGQQVYNGNTFSLAQFAAYGVSDPT